jgi:putative ABC transport system permease protein
MGTFKQTAFVTGLNLKSLPQRLGTSSVVVVGIAGVVGVLVSILAMVTGLSQMAAGTGRPDRAIITSSGSSSEVLSNLSRDAVRAIGDAPGLRRGEDGKPVLSAETLVVVRAPLRKDGSGGSLLLRGVGPAAFAIRPQVRLIAGRFFRPGNREVIVGRTAHQQFRGLDVGQSINLRGAQWTVVGIFESGHDLQEAGLMADSETVQSAFQRAFQSVAVMLGSAGSFSLLKEALKRNPVLAVDVERESDYYAQQSQALTRIISLVAYLVGGIMAVGAIFSALNAMYSAMSTRTVEIATLRVLGFGSGAVVASVFAEALLLAGLGGVIGGGLAWLLFNGNTVSTNGGGFTQLAVPLIVNAGLIGQGILLACVIGMVGASLPAFRAIRAPLASALRGT